MLPRKRRSKSFSKTIFILISLGLFSFASVAYFGRSTLNKKNTIPFSITSPSFAHMDSIPVIHSHDGKGSGNLSPPLTWSGVPDGTKSFTLIMDDPDAPDPANPKMTWVHWVLYNLPSTTTELRMGKIGGKTELPAGTMVANNDWKVRNYGGPSPPIGKHRYFHKLYALDVVLPQLGPDASKSEVERAMEGHIIDNAIIIGFFEKGLHSSQ